MRFRLSFFLTIISFWFTWIFACRTILSDKTFKTYFFLQIINRNIYLVIIIKIRPSIWMSFFWLIYDSMINLEDLSISDQSKAILHLFIIFFFYILFWFIISILWIWFHHCLPNNTFDYFGLITCLKPFILVSNFYKF